MKIYWERRREEQEKAKIEEKEKLENVKKLIDRIPNDKILNKPYKNAKKE